MRGFLYLCSTGGDGHGFCYRHTDVRDIISRHNYFRALLDASLLWTFCLMIVVPAYGQNGTPVPPPISGQAAPQAKVSVLTCAPGAEIYQLEGHTALRLQIPAADGSTARDVVVNWGVFDFAAPNFVYRFVKGETDYMALAYPTQLFLEEYRREGRRVIEQTLSLTPAQTDSLMEAISLNLLPKNRTYRYNYVLDNCATRPMELLTSHAGVADTAPFGSTEAGEQTFRSEMRRYHTNYPWYQFGIDLALGSGLDRKISERERNFAPVELQKALAKAQKADGSPLVEATDILMEGPEEGTAEGKTPALLTPMAVALYILLAAIILSILDIKQQRLSRWFDSLLFGAYGVLGLLLTFLIVASSHYATSPNWLYLWLNPLCLFAAAGVWIKSWRRAVYCYQICNFAAVAALCAVGCMGVQSLNVAFLPLMGADLLRSATFIYLNRK